MGELAKIKHSTTLKVIECGTCGIAFGLPETLFDHCYEEGGSMYCPLGHQRGWAEGQNERDERDKEHFKKELKRVTKEKEWAQREAEIQKKSASAYKGQVTKLKRRGASGTCPCCTRTFKQLRAHMNNMHPEYVDDQKLTN